MKKYIASLVTLTLALIPANAGKPTRHQQIYSLPQSVVTVTIQTTQQSIIAGPYARYANSLLGISTIEKDSTIFTISGIEITTTSEPDQSKRYSVLLDESNESAFQALAENGLICLGTPSATANASVTLPVKPIDTKAVESTRKTAEKAAQAAEDIKKYREDRYNILIGNTDATYSGEALGAAIGELNREEAELTSLFLPTTQTDINSTTFDFLLSPSLPRRIEAFCFSPSLGLLPSGSPEGIPYYLDITVSSCIAASQSEAVSKDNSVRISYRVPAICEIKLCCYDHVLCHVRVPIYQFGTEETINL